MKILAYQAAQLTDIDVRLDREGVDSCQNEVVVVGVVKTAKVHFASFSGEGEDGIDSVTVRPLDRCSLSLHRVDDS